MAGNAKANCPYGVWFWFWWISVSNPDPGSFDLYMIGPNKRLTISSSGSSCAQMWGVAQNPKGDIWISGNAEFYGKMKGAQLDDGPGNDGGEIHIDLDSEFE